MKYLGIDWGEKRIGLAYGDELGLAFPITPAVAPAKKERLRQIEAVVRERGIEAMVVGYPLNMDGSAGFKAREVDAFIGLLEKRFRLPVHRVDERLTSVAAEGLSRESKRKPDRKSGELDSRAAAILLQDFLDGATGGPALENE